MNEQLPTDSPREQVASLALESPGALNRVVSLDVREDIRSGREPFSKIMSVAGRLQPGEQLQLIAPFEPIPLCQLLAKQGFTHTAHSLGSGDWEVLFTLVSRPTTSEPPMAHPSCPQAPSETQATEFLELDARGLEPPQPLVKILEALSGLSNGTILRARTDRRPMHLYPQLQERGFQAETKEESDGSFTTQIRR